MKKRIRKVRSKIQSVVRRLPLLLNGRPSANAISSDYGVWLHPNEQDLTFQFYVKGAYGYFLSKFLKSQRNAFTFLDIGANQGLYTVLASRNRKCLHAYAFEPVPQSADLLQKNLVLNGSRNVTVCRNAVSDVTGTLAIGVKDQHSGVASLRATNIDADTQMMIDVIDASGLNALIASNTSPIIVKIDVEGHELTVLRELLRTDFARRLSAIFYEVDEAWMDPDDAIDILKRNGFTRFDQQGSAPHYDVLARR